jgi:hypothetical protein
MENPETLTTLDTRHEMKARKTKTLHRKLKDEQQSPQQIESRMWTQVYEQYQWLWKNIALISYCIVQHKENVNWDVIKFYIMHSRRLSIWELQRLFIVCFVLFLFFVVLLFLFVSAFSLSVGQMIAYIMKHTLQFIYFTIIYLQFRNYRLTLKIWFPICCANTLVIWRKKYVRLVC